SLRLSMESASGADLIVSFLMESGVRMLIEELKPLAGKKIPIRILTGNYLGITQPSALYLLKQEFGDRIDLRFYNEPSRSFHAKAYLIHHDGWNEIYVGSSNVSRSAFTSGIEWNYRFTDREDPSSLQKFQEEFELLFSEHSQILDDDTLHAYAENWHRPALYRDLERYDQHSEILNDQKDSGIREVFFHPRGAQIEALYDLDEIRKDGASSALVQAATGIGKTYLAAFDSRPFHRVLFVAHRHEILNQAAASFRNIRPSDSIGFFEGETKDTDADLLFASVATLGRKENLELFDPDSFDYIVIDEFHHAVTNLYRNIMNYFHPKFLLGLTATPERLDGRNIYELCDYNVAFEMDLYTAINQGYLVPFHYYGIYDEVNYDSMRIRNGKYSEEDLNAAYIGNQKRYELIYESYRKYPSQRALGFCASRKHADNMADEFTRRGIPSAAVYSGEGGKHSLPREEALEKLQKGELKVLFSVDMFNEGLDVPDLDMVLFLRPTESPVVFLQQLGRGLRKAAGKQYLNVLDFIGNYTRASRTPSLLSHMPVGPHGPGPVKPSYPDDCIVDFDLQLLDLFRKMEERSLSIRERIRNEIVRVKEEVGHVPARMDLFTCMQDDLYEYCYGHAKENPFRNYLAYLHENHWLTPEEVRIYQNETAEGFLNLLETTSMSKVYKMPVLMAFWNNGSPLMQVTDEQVLKTWKEFFGTGTNWKDLNPGSGREAFLAMSDRQHLSRIHQMPINFLLKSGNGYFYEKEGYALALNESLRPYIDNPAFIAQFRDIIEYRAMSYYRSRYLKRQRKLVS
ncbi:MAG: DEAD/DEAH box helicase family protein, partial [Bulleidia sp.]